LEIVTLIAKLGLLLQEEPKMVTTRHIGRKALMDAFLATLEEGDKLKKSLSQVWDWEVTDKADEKMIWDCTRTKLKGVNDKLLEEMKNAGSIEIAVGNARLTALRAALELIESEFPELLRTRGDYVSYTEEETWAMEMEKTILSRLEKAISAGYELPAVIEEIGEGEE
tara:strand:- start:71 stop:574 length:504 start_codon:yes stop_codon:yes gene_type:complete